MIFEQHNNLRGKHAFLSPSQPQWLKYSKEQLRQKRISSYSQPMGTSLHALAETLIANGLKLKKGDKLTVLSHLLTDGIPREVIDMDRIYNNLMTYVNDAIGFRLTPEQVLYYSDACFGTADAISFKNNLLRFHGRTTSEDWIRFRRQSLYKQTALEPQLSEKKWELMSLQ